MKLETLKGHSTTRGRRHNECVDGAVSCGLSVRGEWYIGRPVMVTYHPSYLLRNNSNRAKRVVWEDLLKVMERAPLPISERQRNFFLER